MHHGKCSKKYPKSFNPETKQDDDGYPIYKRRDNGRYIEKGSKKIDNRFIVPHNKELVVKYQCHINVELCNKSKAIKYLFKYIHKGTDRANIVIRENAFQKDKEEETAIKVTFNFKTTTKQNFKLMFLIAKKKQKNYANNF